MDKQTHFSIIDGQARDVEISFLERKTVEKRRQESKRFLGKTGSTVSILIMFLFTEAQKMTKHIPTFCFLTHPEKEMENKEIEDKTYEVLGTKLCMIPTCPHYSKC